MGSEDFCGALMGVVDGSSAKCLVVTHTHPECMPNNFYAYLPMEIYFHHNFGV